MFGFSSNVSVQKLQLQIKELNNTINTLEANKAVTNRAKEVLQRELDELRGKAAKEFATATHVIDWKAMNAFSIERMLRDGHYITNIGYFINTPVDDCSTVRKCVNEWTMQCSHAEHQRLAAEFAEYIKNRGDQL